MKYRYHLIEVPAEFADNSKTRVQVFTETSPGVFDYVMDLVDLARICRVEGWTLPTSRNWCEFPERLETFVVEKENCK